MHIYLLKFQSMGAKGPADIKEGGLDQPSGKPAPILESRDWHRGITTECQELEELTQGRMEGSDRRMKPRRAWRNCETDGSEETKAGIQPSPIFSLSRSSCSLNS